MTSVRADEIRVPRKVRDAVGRHEHVLVFNRERPVLAIVHPDDLPNASPRRGRRLSDVAARLHGVRSPDPNFADDLTEVLDSVGEGPTDPWA
jgi:hypothetical protein